MDLDKLYGGSFIDWDAVAARSAFRENEDLYEGAANPFVRTDQDDAVTWENAAAEHFELGLHSFRSGDYDAALAQWQAATALDPDNRTYLANLNRLLQLMGDGT